MTDENVQVNLGQDPRMSYKYVYMYCIQYSLTLLAVTLLAVTLLAIHAVNTIY
jgi:hypothetical protein